MPEVLGRYRLMKLLSTGGMGEVFLARQEGPAGFAKTVVVKRVLRHLAKDQGFIDLFLNEAQLAAQLQHPNIAQVFGLEREGEAWFMAMEYVHGRSVRDVLDMARNRSRGLMVPPAVAARLASQALQGLDYAHHLTDSRGRPLGILHRDVTPENLLVSFSGLVKLVDFGIARAMTGAVTRVGRPKGKVGYMAPELTASGSRVDGRADLYGVGVVLYEMLRLTRPANVPSTTSDAVASERKPYRRDPAVPAGLNDILVKAMAPAPKDRFASAGAMSDALESWLTAQGQTVLSSDVVAFLETLYGRSVIEANPAVLPLAPSDQPSSSVVALGGTQPLSALSAAVFAPSLSGLPVVHSPPPAAPRRWSLRSGLLIGAGVVAVTSLGVGFALWHPAAGPRATVAAPGPNSPRPENLADAGTPALATDADAGAEVEERLAEAGGEAELGDEEPTDAGLGPDRRPFEASSKTSRQRHKKARPGKVIIKVMAGAEVFYAGKSLGVTPLDPVEVPAGTAVFVVRLRKLGVTRRVLVRVPSGGVVVLRADLGPR